MSNAIVQELLHRIAQLSDDDRMLLEERLAEISEEAWQREAAQARQVALDRGVDQAAIDEAIREARYGS